MSSSNPTIVLIHSGLHDEASFERLKDALHNLSFPAVSGTLPTVSSPTPKLVDLSSDIDFVRTKLILPLLEEGKDVVVAMHSYGGIVGNSAVQGLSKTERMEEGEKGGVLGLVNIVTLILPVGASCMAGWGGGWDAVPYMHHDKEKGTVALKAAIDTIDNGQSRNETTETLKLYRPHSTRPFKAKVQYTAFSDPAYRGKCAYLMCEDDESLPYTAQQKFVETCGFAVTKSLKASHMVVWTMPKETAAFIIEATRRFEV